MQDAHFIPFAYNAGDFCYTYPLEVIDGVQSRSVETRSSLRPLG